MASIRAMSTNSLNSGVSIAASSTCGQSFQSELAFAVRNLDSVATNEDAKSVGGETTSSVNKTWRRSAWTAHRKLWRASRRAINTFATSAQTYSSSAAAAGATTMSRSTSYSNLEGGSVNHDEFERLSMLGEGTYGKIYLVKRKKTGALFAQKVMKRKRAGLDLKNELKILASIVHPFVVQCRHVCDGANGAISIVMDYAANGTMRELLQATPDRRVDEQSARVAAAELASAVLHLHSAAIVHRDIKPSNILIDGDGHCLLSDFGLAAVCDTSSKKLQRFCGTVEYCAPELLRGEKYGVAVDWWAFGCVVHELVAGRSPFNAPTARDLFSNILKLEPDLTKVPPGAQSFVVGLLNKEATLRLGSTKAYDTICDHDYFCTNPSTDWAAVGERQSPRPFATYLTLAKTARAKAAAAKARKKKKKQLLKAPSEAPPADDTDETKSAEALTNGEEPPEDTTTEMLTTKKRKSEKKTIAPPALPPPPSPPPAQQGASSFFLDNDEEQQQEEAPLTVAISSPARSSSSRRSISSPARSSSSSRRSSLSRAAVRDDEGGTTPPPDAWNATVRELTSEKSVDKKKQANKPLKTQPPSSPPPPLTPTMSIEHDDRKARRGRKQISAAAQSSSSAAAAEGEEHTAAVDIGDPRLASGMKPPSYRTHGISLRPAVNGSQDLDDDSDLDDNFDVDLDEAASSRASSRASSTSSAANSVEPSSPSGTMKPMRRKLSSSRTAAYIKPSAPASSPPPPKSRKEETKESHKQQQLRRKQQQQQQQVEGSPPKLESHYQVRLSLSVPGADTTTSSRPAKRRPSSSKISAAPASSTDDKGRRRPSLADLLERDKPPSSPRGNNKLDPPPFLFDVPA